MAVRGLKSVVGVLFSPSRLRRLNLRNSRRSKFSGLRLSRLVQAKFLAVLSRCSDAAEPRGQLWNLLTSLESTGYLFLFCNSVFEASSCSSSSCDVLLSSKTSNPKQSWRCLGHSIYLNFQSRDPAQHLKLRRLVAFG